MFKLLVILFIIKMYGRNNFFNWKQYLQFTIRSSFQIIFRNYKSQRKRKKERDRETETDRETERQRERDSERQREKSFQTVLTNYYRINDSKQYLQTIIRESFQTILTNYCQRIQTILTNYYQRTNCKLHLEDIREFNSFQRILLIYSTFIISNSSQTMLLALA